MKLTSTSFADNQKIPRRIRLLRSRSGAPCLPRPQSQPAARVVRHPCRHKVLRHHLPRSGRTKAGDDVNQEGRTVPARCRVDFFHWVLVDLPASVLQIAEGEFSSDVTPRGKSGPRCSTEPVRASTTIPAGLPATATCAETTSATTVPAPVERRIRHRYVFTVFALDVERLPLDGKFGGQQVRDAMAGHILRQAAITGVG